MQEQTENYSSAPRLYPSRILRMNEVINRTGLKRTTIYLYRKADKFPKPVQLGERGIGWLECDIEEWIESCVKNSEIN